MEIGRIHSIETMGLVDGPGIRVVIFMQGCKLRCAYCHNPDTWNLQGGIEMTSAELFNKIKRYKSYFKNSGGGVTLSGGDPLLQSSFAAEFFKLCRTEGIHTTLDTSGYGHGNYSEVLKYTDLVLLDIKHIDETEHKNLTGYGRAGFLEFLEAVKAASTPLWIRHVVVPGLTDSKEHIKKLALYINTLANVEKVELLPYHTHGISKYESLKMTYRLTGIEDMDKTKLEELYEVLYSNMISKPLTRLYTKTSTRKKKQSTIV